MENMTSISGKDNSGHRVTIRVSDIQTIHEGFEDKQGVYHPEITFVILRQGPTVKLQEAYDAVLSAYFKATKTHTS